MIDQPALTTQDANPPATPSVPESGGARLSGTVKWFDPKKGFGFITREEPEKDVFFHSTDARKSGIDDELEGGERVSFVLAPTPRGTKAVHIRREPV
jgi:CspA family cold shock protein